MPTIKGPIKIGPNMTDEDREKITKVLFKEIPIEKSDRYKELKKLIRKEQIELIKELNPESKVPRYEHDRILLILELRGK